MKDGADDVKNSDESLMHVAKLQCHSRTGPKEFMDDVLTGTKC